MTDHVSVIFTSALKAATDIQVAMCRIAVDHPAQDYLDNALHNALIAAEECRQAWADARAALRRSQVSRGDES